MPVAPVPTATGAMGALLETLEMQAPMAYGETGVRLVTQATLGLTVQLVRAVQRAPLGRPETPATSGLAEAAAEVAEVAAALGRSHPMRPTVAQELPAAVPGATAGRLVTPHQDHLATQALVEDREQLVAELLLVPQGVLETQAPLVPTVLQVHRLDQETQEPLGRLGTQEPEHLAETLETLGRLGTQELWEQRLLSCLARSQVELPELLATQATQVPPEIAAMLEPAV